MHRTLISVLVVLVVSFVSATGCGGTVVDPVTTAVTTVLAAKPATPVKDSLWDEVHEFYRLRAGKAAWVIDTPTANAAGAVQLLQSARDHGLAAEDYKATDVAALVAAVATLGKDAPNRAQQLAELDVRITTALLGLGHDVAVGRTKPIQPGWKARRVLPNLTGTLDDAVAGGAGGVKTWLRAIQPVHPEYENLRAALIGLYGQQQASGVRPVPVGADAIRVFQEHHAITPTGTIDAATRAAMSVPLEERIEQVKVNLERWRWMPDDLGARHLLINIPYYHLQARENGKVVSDIRVVVGKPGHETPVFSGVMETVVFSPYWNIPDSIVEGETAPAMAKDPKYLERNNMEILRVTGSGDAKVVNPKDVDWDDVDELKQLVFRQKPGPNNALGHVKFLFPNEFNVYLHDTPADALFARPGRAFSHGCVRVEEPEVLAKYVLRDDAAWSDALIQDAMNAGVEKHVRLKTSLPVHITYFTTWVDDHGGLHFQPDVYGYDRWQQP